MTAYEQRSYPGAAADTLLNADLAAGGLSFSVTPGTGAGYPDGSSGPFFVILDYDNSKAEKVRCTGRTNDTFTIPDTGSRGVDGTTAVAHTANAKVRAVITATDVQEANRAAHYTVGLVTSKGDLLAGTGANALGRVAAGADGTIPIFDSTQTSGVRAGANPALVGATLDGTSTINGVSGTSLATDRTAWDSYTPVLAGATVGNGTVAGAYKQSGKRVTFRAYFALGSTSAINGGVTVSLPVASVAGVVQVVSAIYFDTSPGQLYPGAAHIGGSATICTPAAAGGGVNVTVPFTWAANDQLVITGTYESA